MTEDDARAAVLAAIGQVAPDVDTDGLDDSARFRQDLELDSLDFLRLLETVAGATGVETPENDYASLTTVHSLIGYVAAQADRTQQTLYP
ncbi:acyl carrier protein [Lacisediminihabitans profunda]|uniref:Acyl carrier protein n=1 Tax=Lacisediminihabitans profunda TaxID=2594790 RepID=A0A5C8URC3_9MICO|nr:acyl carrier protein [Lacisediminihabitans profunda]TXN31131.1 acyl carrier protein [Lacisediminihabitans profunda]